MNLWIIATVAAYYIKGLCGFANTLVFTSVLSFGESNAAISPVDLLLGYPMNLILAWKSRKSLEPKIYVPLAMLVLMGSIPGAFLLKNVDVGAIKLFFSKKVLAMIGVLAGVVCGLFGVGALLAVYVGRVTENRDSFKANISMVFIVENTFRILLYGILNLLTPDTVNSAILLMPFALLGLLTGVKCSDFLNEKLVRKFTSMLLVLSGAALILKNL